VAKLLFLLLGVASLVAGVTAATARPAATASATVKITHTGYTPTSVSISAGESVDFTNSDTVAHTVDFKPTTGIRCSAAIPLVIQAAQSASCTFANAGKFTFTDPSSKGKGFRGTVTVAPPPGISLTATPKAAIYGHTVTLAGALQSQQTGQSLQMLAQQCGAAGPTALTNVTTTSGGAYSYVAKPLMQTTYTVKLRNQSSNALTVKVAPQLLLRKVARHRYTLRVSAAQSFAGKLAIFQRYSPTLKRWRGVKGVPLKANTTGAAPTVITSASFRSSLKAKLRVRVVLGQTQVGSCYLPGRSNTIRS
jgi:plastocyanin